MKRSLWNAGVGLAAWTLMATPLASAVAAPISGDFSVSCADGHTYLLRSRAISPAGDLVTGQLYTRPGHGMHVRLIPMGNGYRYLGRGIWLDGIRETAVLNFGKHRAVACTVQSAASPALVRALN